METPDRLPQTRLSAIQDFQNARRRADLETLAARLTGKSVDLLSFEDVRQKLKATESAARELKDIPLDAIVGSVGRCADFTRSFLPRHDSDAERWTGVQLATTDQAGLPPIEVYQVGQVYFVLDGNHRVSVARQLGATHIQAYVTQVHTRVPLEPDVQPDDLIVKAEYADFLEYTHLDQLRPGADLTVSVPGQYTKLEDHIEVHRYFLEAAQGKDIPFEEAAGLWYDEVYYPVVKLIREMGLLRDFPGRTETDLYLWLSEHRRALEKELGWPVRPESALTDLVAHFSPHPRRQITRLGWKIREAVMPEPLQTGPPPGQWRREHLAPRGCDCLFADILVAINGEESGWPALEQALEVARREDAWLHGLHVVPTEAHKESPAAQAIQAEFNRRCEAANVTGRLAIHVGDVTRTLCERAWYTDLVVARLNYPPAPQWLTRLQSGFSNLIRCCPRPVLAVPEQAHLDRALLAYDGSPKAEEALYVAAYLASRWAIPLVVVTMLEQGAKAKVRAREYLEAHQVQAVYVERSGSMAEAVLEIAQEHDSHLILMGGYGYNPLVQAMLDSAVDQVLRQSRRPVLICR